ncbi:hypothetical protein VTK73DRAFT_10373 [Phialemonium thermophilum]|uniref:Uncharacterized protein n=1 Tax=Phialemonium thermophilum TaxID=223376 RepID=A0ABR3VX39_9PEZI
MGSRTRRRPLTEESLFLADEFVFGRVGGGSSRGSPCRGGSMRCTAPGGPGYSRLAGSYPRSQCIRCGGEEVWPQSYVEETKQGTTTRKRETATYGMRRVMGSHLRAGPWRGGVGERARRACRRNPNKQGAEKASMVVTSAALDGSTASGPATLSDSRSRWRLEIYWRPGPITILRCPREKDTSVQGHLLFVGIAMSVGSGSSMEER